MFTKTVKRVLSLAMLVVVLVGTACASIVIYERYYDPYQVPPPEYYRMLAKHPVPTSL